MFGNFALSEAPFSSLAGGNKDASANIIAVSSIIVNGTYIVSGAATSASTSIIELNAYRTAFGGANIDAISSITANATSIRATITIVFSESNMTANSSVVYISSSLTESSSNVVASGVKKWENTTDISETWTTIEDVSESWTTATN